MRPKKLLADEDGDDPFGGGATDDSPTFRINEGYARRLEVRERTRE